MRRLLTIILLFSIFSSFTACSGSPLQNDEVDGFKIAVCLASEPLTMDPALNNTIDGAIMLNHAFEGLVKWVDDGKGNAVLAPGMAESWDVSDDSLTYTFHIRKEASWSDGEPVTAHDFEYAWRRLVDPKTGAEYSYILDCVKNAAEISSGQMSPYRLAAYALDDYTFEVTLHTAVTYFINIAAFPATFPVREDIIEKYGEQWIFSSSSYVTNGPYTMTEWVHNSYIRMKANENYYDASNLGPDTIKFVLMRDNKAILAAFNNNELDFARYFPVDKAKGLLESDQIKIANYIGTCYVSFQTESIPFSDPQLREALSLAIDRNYIVSKVTGTGEIPATGLVPYGIHDATGLGSDFRELGGAYYSDDYELNCEKAKQLLAEAGYSDLEDFPVVECIYKSGDRNREIAEALKTMWETKLGIKVDMTELDRDEFFDRRKEGDYSILINGWIADYNDPICFLDIWVSENANNDAKYSNPSYDELIYKAKTTKDKDERFELMHDAEDMLMADHIVAPIYFYTQPYMISDRLSGVYYTP
ncbi:MAG: peptide ABC transporter substrate-binding protein, partial [Clostridiales bacterium]|nr:peptide ABC transporter substrate-binding protein [Clostridiales bacterium]